MFKTSKNLPLIIISLLFLLGITYFVKMKLGQRLELRSREAQLLSSNKLFDSNFYKENEAGKEIKTKEACESKQGRWEWKGDQIFECYLLTHDYGKACSDMSECEAACFMKLTPDQEMKVNRGEQIEIKGQCSKYLSETPCNGAGFEVHKGKPSLDVYCS
jgi:hypothetical protein